MFGQIRLERSDGGFGLKTYSRIPPVVYNSGPSATAFGYRAVEPGTGLHTLHYVPVASGQLAALSF